MLRKRIIACLDIKEGRALRDAQLPGLVDARDPVEIAKGYEAEGADEVFFLDVSDGPEGRRPLLDVVSRTAQSLFIPLTVAGSINEVADVALILRAGADKVTINTAGIKRPELIGEASVRFGKQCVIASIDARLEKRTIELVSRTEPPQQSVVPGMGAGAGASAQPAPAPPTGSWLRVFAQGGRSPTELDAIAWAQQCVAMGAGEVLVTSIDRDGRRLGYDLELTARIVEAVSVPVIASGGAGTAEHVRDAFLLAGADAALASGMFHDGVESIAHVKQVLADAGVAVRRELSV